VAPAPLKPLAPLCGNSTSAELTAADRGFGADTLKPFVFVHLGDAQIGIKWHGSVRKQVQRVADAVSQVNDLAPAFVVMAGDLAHQRKPKQWAAFDAELCKLRVPVMLTAGNHDTPDPTQRRVYIERYGRDYYATTYNNCMFLVINSMLFTEAFNGEKAAADQWMFVETTLAAAHEKRRIHVIISVHYPPSPGRAEIPKRLLELARKHGARTFLSGHTHKNQVIKAKDGAYTAYVTAGTNALFRLGRGADHSYRIFRVYADRIEQTSVHVRKTSMEEKKRAATLAPR
jgi:DNA repair exonuclease SbcCD nuclease subunit